MEFTSIYGLFDPRTPDVIMYVGKGLEKRARSHWKEFSRGSATKNYFLRYWLFKLKGEGIVPGWKFLEENVPVDIWSDREKFWIAYWRERNSNLCNIFEGGNAPPESSAHLGGLIGGKRCHELHPGLASRNGKRRMELHGNPATFETCSAGGRIGSKRIQELYPSLHRDVLIKRHKEDPGFAKKIGKEGMRRARELYPEKMKSACKLGGVATCHLRWHIRRGIWNPECSLCFSVI